MDLSGAPQGRLPGAGEGFSLRFPSSSIGTYFLNTFYNHTHRMWGSIESRGTTADRGRRKGGGRTGSQGSKWVVRVRVQATLRTRCDVLGITLGLL